MKILITGGAGFIGSHVVRLFVTKYPDYQILNLDALTYAGNPANLAGIAEAHPERYHFVHGDITDEALIARLFAEERIDTVIHLAAESHVDRSIDGPAAFMRTNIHGTFVLLQAARSAWQGRSDVRFHHVSTDEVFGSLGEAGFFTETTAYDPSSPYSASKAASDHLVRAWHRTFGLPITITNCSNNYGPYQFPEKLIPVMIQNALTGKPLPIYGDGRNIRDWLHVADHCRAIDVVVRRAAPGTTYTVGGHNELTNINLVRTLCHFLDELRPSARPDGYAGLITYVTDRPGHDHRYAIDASRIQADLGWAPQHTVESGMRATVRWYLNHQDWVQAIAARTATGQRLGLGR